MATIPVVNHRRYFGQYELNISARKLDSNPFDVYHELIVRTVKLWLYLAAKISENVTVLPEQIAYHSVEQSIEEDTNGGLTPIEFDDFNENRVTVFDWNHKLELTIHSNSLPQSVLDLYWAMNSAKQTLEALYPIAPQSNVAPPNSNATTPQATTTPNSANSAQFVEGAIFANSRPDSRKVQYADGQVLIYNINRIVASTFKTKVDNKTVPIIELYSPFSTQHPTLKVYIYKNNSQELSPQWLGIKDIVEPLNLGALKPEATGNWQATAKVSHAEKEGKTVEYFNVVSLKAI